VIATRARLPQTRHKMRNTDNCHSREGGNPKNPTTLWIPACAGMTI
jgi:hypothetical protein